jgi:hypothetical protein
MFRHFVPRILVTVALLWCTPLPMQAATNRESGVAPICNAMGNLVALTTTWRDTGISRAEALKQLRIAAPDSGQRALAEVFVAMPYDHPQISGAQIMQTFHAACPGLIRQALRNK